MTAMPVETTAAPQQLPLGLPELPVIQAKPQPIYHPAGGHTLVVGTSWFYCIQRDCDREHHVWCSCRG